MMGVDCNNRHVLYFISEILLLVTATFIIQEQNISDLKKKKKKRTPLSAM